MNKKVAFLVCILIGTVAFGASFFLGSIQNTAALASTAQHSQQTLLTTLRYLSEGLRNDLLLGNFRQARNTLESMRSDLLFDHYRILQGTKVIEQSYGPDSVPDDKNYIRSDVNVLFSPNGSPWGTITFLSNKENILQLERRLAKQLWFSSLANAFVVVLVVCLLIFLFWRSSESLRSSFENLVTGQPARADQSTVHLWGPLINEMETVAQKSIELQKELSDAKVNSALLTLATHVAHDIRSPLSALHAAVGNLDASPAECKTLIRSSIVRITDIADDLLEKHRQNRNRNQENVAYNIQEIVRKIVDEKKFELREPITFLADPAGTPEGSQPYPISPVALSRILSNLINNAIQAGAKNISISTREYSSQVSLTLSDDGSGMTPEVLAEIQAGTHESSAGNGIGLSHARSAIQEAQGRLEILSRLGKGTMITLTIPKYAPGKGDNSAT